MTNAEQPDTTHNMQDYDQTRRDFHLDVPETFNWARDVIGRMGRRPGPPGDVWVGPGGERRITFAEFDRRANQVAAALRDAGRAEGRPRGDHAAARARPGGRRCWGS